MRRLEGPDGRPERPAIAEALRALDAPKRPPTEADAPTPGESLKGLPTSPGQREALRLTRARRMTEAAT